MSSAGALNGLRIIELAGIGPGPFAGMMLADHGAEVIRIDRPGTPPMNVATDGMSRSRRSICLDLKKPGAVDIVRRLAAGADGLIEGFRPGVIERLGIGPGQLLADNPRLVIGRMTGWGQDGPYAQAAGHDINYIALTGALHAIGNEGCKPVPPLNLLGDFGGGGMLMAFGMLCGILSAKQTGKGQVIDCSIVEGASLLMTMIWSMRADTGWREERGANALDGGTHFYNVYETADGQYVSLASGEPAFYATMRKLLEIDGDPSFDDQMNPELWPALKEKMARIIKARTRQQWCDLLEGTDACFAPVLSMTEALDHPHIKARSAFKDVGGAIHPAPAPKFSDTPAVEPRPAPQPGADTCGILADLGLSSGEIASLLESRAAYS